MKAQETKDAELVAIAALVLYQAAGKIAWATGKFPGDPGEATKAVDLLEEMLENRGY